MRVATRAVCVVALAVRYAVSFRRACEGHSEKESSAEAAAHSRAAVCAGAHRTTRIELPCGDYAAQSRSSDSAPSHTTLHPRAQRPLAQSPPPPLPSKPTMHPPHSLVAPSTARIVDPPQTACAMQTRRRHTRDCATCSRHAAVSPHRAWPHMPCATGLPRPSPTRTDMGMPQRRIPRHSSLCQKPHVIS